MRRSQFVLATAPSVYPFQKPFYDTPFDQDRPKPQSRVKYPKWMQHGIDGTGRGIGLYRPHPLSKRNKGNYVRVSSEMPRIFSMMMNGVRHKSGHQLYSTSSKPPNPSKHPFITGSPHSVYGWRVNEPHLIKEFNTPHVSKDQIRYKPYVALHEKGLLGSAIKPSTSSAAASDSVQKPAKPLLKRLFFWQ